MTIGIAQISEGKIILPLELENKLAGISKLLVWERGDTIVLEKTVSAERPDLMEAGKKVRNVGIAQRNRRAVELLDAWMRETTEHDAAWWDNFEAELRQNRVIFRSN